MRRKNSAGYMRRSGGTKMQYEPAIFREQFPLVKYFVCHLTYYRELNHKYSETELKSPFWTLTIDAHLVQSIIYWCMVFGSEGCNPTHWKHLSESNVDRLRESFRQFLFTRTNFTASTWETYWKEIVDFRNEYVAHRELNYKKPVPYLDFALEVAFVYDEWIRHIISPDILEEPPLKEFTAELQRSVKPLATELLSTTKQHENT
jgi:hypothetical protein